MEGVVAQLRAILHRLQHRAKESPDSPECPEKSSSRPSANSLYQYPIEHRELSALPLIFAASVFNLITSDSMAYPDTAFTFRKWLLESLSDDRDSSAFGKFSG